MPKPTGRTAQPAGMPLAAQRELPAILALLRERRHDAAEARARQFVKLMPDIAAGWDLLGACLHGMRRPQEACDAWRRALRLDPHNAGTMNNLAAGLMASGQLREAEALLRQALAIRPDHADAAANLGAALRQQGQPAAAIEAYRQAIAADPRRAGLHHNLGTAFRDIGRLTEAEAAYREALRLRPGHADTLRHLSLVKRFGDGDPDLQDIVARLARPELAESDAAHLNYAAGKAYDDIGRADQAFSHYLEGARLWRRRLRYEVSEDERFFAFIRDGFPMEMLTNWRPEGAAASVFVIGMPRSGTTLVEQILDGHPRLCGVGERTELGDLVRERDAATGRRFPEWLNRCAPREFRALGAHYRERLAAIAQPGTATVDKMPANFRFAGLIPLILPQARIIHIRRNPVDTCVSCLKQFFPPPYSYDLSELGRYFAAYHRLMEHWRAVLPSGLMLEIAYEDLVEAPETQIRRVLTHCGLDWAPQCLSFHERRTTVQTASAAQVRRPLYADSVGRWRRYERHLGPLLEALGPLATPV